MHREGALFAQYFGGPESDRRAFTTPNFAQVFGQAITNPDINHDKVLGLTVLVVYVTLVHPTPSGQAAFVVG